MSSILSEVNNDRAMGVALQNFLENTILIDMEVICSQQN